MTAPPIRDLKGAMIAALKTSLWIEAHIRTCFSLDCPAFIVARGDADRGGVLLKVDRFDSGIFLYERTLDFDGNRVWQALNGGLDSAQAQSVVEKKRSYDADLWVLEIEDLRGIYQLDAPLLGD